MKQIREYKPLIAKENLEAYIVNGSSNKAPSATVGFTNESALPSDQKPTAAPSAPPTAASVTENNTLAEKQIPQPHPQPQQPTQVKHQPHKASETRIVGHVGSGIGSPRNWTEKSKSSSGINHMLTSNSSPTQSGIEIPIQRSARYFNRAAASRYSDLQTVELTDFPDPRVAQRLASNEQLN